MKQCNCRQPIATPHTIPYLSSFSTLLIEAIQCKQPVHADFAALKWPAGLGWLDQPRNKFHQSIPYSLYRTACGYQLHDQRPDFDNVHGHIRMSCIALLTTPVTYNVSRPNSSSREVSRDFKSATKLEQCAFLFWDAATAPHKNPWHFIDASNCW